MNFSTGNVEERIKNLESPDPEVPPSEEGGPAGDPAGDLPEIDPELEEVKALLLDGFMGVIGWIYEQRAKEAGPHWNLSIEEASAIERPAERVIEKWTPVIAAWVPGFALKIKEEVVLVMVIYHITRKRVKIDQALAEENAVHHSDQTEQV